MSKIYVNSAWTAESALPDGLIWGETAFASFDEAVQSLADNDTEIALLSDSSLSVVSTHKLNVVSGDGNNYNLDVSAEISVDAVFAKEINLDAGLFCAYYNNHNVVVNGNLNGGFYNYIGTLTFNNTKFTNCYENSNIGGIVNINGDGTWTVDNPQAGNLMFINIGRSDWLGQGILNLNDSVVKAITFSVDSNSADAKSQINAVNSTICTVLNDGIQGDFNVGANGEVNLTNSDLIVVGTMTNNGTVSVSGESSLNIAKLTGNVTALNGTVLKDSTVGGAGSLIVGEGGYNATVTFKGANEIGKVVAFSGSKIVVGDDASLELSGARSGFGNGATWDIDGKIENAKAITDEQKAELTVSLNLVQGLSMSTTNGADSVMNIDNAYVVIGKSNGMTSKNSNAAGGKFDINVTNSIIDAGNNFAVYEPTKENSPVYDIDFEDSVLNFGSNLLNADKNSSMIFDNSTVTVNSSFRNDGTFELLNGSEMTVNYYIQESSGNAGMYGAVKIDDSTLVIKNSTAGHATINRGSIELSNGGNLTADYLTNYGDETTQGTIDVDGSTLDVTNLTNSGTITLSETGVLEADSIKGADGKIVVNVTDDWKGVAKVIDIDNASTFGSVTIDEADAADGVKAKVDENGDLIVYNVDAATVYVDSAWATGYTFGQEIGEGSGKYFGINAFATFDSAYSAAKETADANKSASTVVVLSDATASQQFYNDNVNVIVKSGVTLKSNTGVTEVNYNKNNGKGTFTVEAGATVNGVHHYIGEFVANGTADNMVVVNLNNPQKAVYYSLQHRGSKKWVVQYADIDAGLIYINGSAEFTNCDIYAYRASHMKGTYTDTTVVIDGNNHDGYYSKDGTTFTGMTMIGGSLTSGSAKGAKTADIITSLTLDGTTAVFKGASKDTVTKLVMKNGATATFEAGADISTLTLSDTSSAVFNGDSTVVAKKKVTVTGNASVEFDNLVNNGTIEIDSTASLKADMITYGENGGITIKMIDALEFGKSTSAIIFDNNKEDGKAIDTSKISIVYGGEDFAGYQAVLDNNGDLIITNTTETVTTADQLKEKLATANCLYIDTKITVDSDLATLIEANYNKLVFGAAGLLLWNSTEAPAWLTDYKYADNILLAPTAAVIDPGTEGNSVEINFTDGANGIIDDITDADLDPAESGTPADTLIVNSTGSSEIRSDINLTNGANIILNNNDADDNSKELKVTGSIQTTGDVIINNKNSFTGTDDEAVLNGGSNEHGAQVTGSNVTLNNDGHANIDFTATGTEEDSGIITIVNNSKKTLEGSAEGKIVRVIASENNDGHVANFTSTASEYTEIADQSVENSDFVGNLVITGDTEFVGEEASSVSVTAKVINGATAKVDKDAVVNVGEYLFAGDKAYSGLPNSTEGGIIEISGTVNASQTNSNADGSIIIENGGTLNTPILNLENGSLSDRNSGSVEIKAGGTVSAAQINLITGDAEMTIAGDFNVTNDRGSGTGVAFLNSGTVTINGGKLNFDMSDPAKVDVSVDQTGLVNSKDIIINGGELLVYSQKGVTNNGTLKVTGSEASTVKAAITGNALQLENGVLENSDINGKVRVYGNSVIQGSANEYDGDELVKDNSTKLGIVEINFENTKVNGYRPSYSETPVTLTIQGTNITTSTVYVGNDTVPADNPDYVAGTLKVIGDNDKSTVDLTTGNVYNRINGYIEISEANVVMTQLQNYGEVLVKNGSVLDLTHADSFTVCSKDDTTVANDCAVLTVDGATVLGGKMYIGQEASGGSSETATAVGSGKVVLSNGASLNLTTNLWMLKEDDKFDISMEVSSDSTLTVGGKLFMGSGSSLTVDVAGVNEVASITAKTLAGDGTITVNVAEDFSGVYKVIELSGTESLKDKNIVEVNAADNVSVVYGADGDVTLVNVDTATLYVNSDWADSDPATAGNQAYEIGDAIPDTNGELAYGFNAFASINDAIKKAEELGGAKIDLTESKFSGSEAGLGNAYLFQTNGTYTFSGGNYIDFAYVDTTRPTADNEGKVDVNIVFDGAKVTAGKFRLDNGASLTIKNSYVDGQSAGGGSSTGWTTFYGDSTITVENSVIGWFTTRQNVESDTIVAGDQITNYFDPEKAGTGTHIGRMCYCGSGVMTVSNSTVFTYPSEGDGYSLEVYDKGLMSFTNSAVYAYSLRVGHSGSGTSTVGRDKEIATMTFYNSTLRNTTSNGTSSERITVGGNNAGKLKFENSIVEKGSAAMTVAGNGEVEIINTDFSVASVTINKTEATETEEAKIGSISVSGGSFSADTVTNNGTFNVTGAATLDIGSLTGSIGIADNGNLVGSTVNNGTIVSTGLTGKMTGSNTVGALQIGYGGDSAVALSITGNQSVASIIVGNKGTLNIGNAEAERTSVTSRAHAYWINDSTVNVTNADVTVTNDLSMTGEITLDNATLKAGTQGQCNYGNSDGKVTLKNNSWLEYGWQFYIGGYSLNQVATLDVNASTVKANQLWVSADADVKLTAGTLISTSVFNLAGDILMDEKSMIDASNGTFTSTGTITVNVTDGWRGSKVILDAAVGTEIGAVEVDAADAADGLKVKFDEATGDLIAYNIDTKTVYVDGNWPNVHNPDYTFGEELAEGKFSGINAFGDAADAIREAAVNANIGKIEVDENTSTVLYAFAVNNNITTENKNGLVVDLGNHGVSVDKDMNTVVNGEINNDYEGAESAIIANGITIDENVKVIADTIFGHGGAYTTNIDGELEVNGAYLRKEGDIEVAGKLTVKDTLSLIADEQTPSLTVTEDGELNAADVYADVNSEITVNGTADVGNLESSGSVNIGASGTLNLTGDADIAELDNDGTFNAGAESTFGTVDNSGIINITDGKTFTAPEVANSGKINVSGTVTVDAVVTGNAVSVNYGAVINDSTLSADLAVASAATIKDSDINGNVTGNAVITIEGENNIVLGDDSQVYYFYVKDDVTLTASDLNSVAIYGDYVNSTLTLNASALNGNYVAGVALNMTDVNYGVAISVNTAITNIKSINGFEVVDGLAGSYIFTDDKGTADDTTDDVTYKLVQSGNEISFKEFAAENNKYEVSSLIAVDDTSLPHVNVEMAEGYASAYIGYQADVEVGALTKSDNGGLTNITVAQEGSLKVNGNIEAVNTLVTGYKSGLKAENISGTGYNDVINIGAFNDGVSLKSIDLKNGWNSMYVGYDSDVTVNGSVSGLASMVIDYLADVTINGDYTAAGYDNSITAIGDLTINGSIINDDINIGTYITTGWNVNFKSGDITYLSGVSFSGGDLVNGEAEYSFTAGKIDGTTYNNVFYFGYAADVTIGDINGRGGYDQIVTGIYGDVVFGNIANIQVISVGGATDFESKQISDVMSFIFTGGVSSTDKAVLTVEAVTTTDYSDYIYIGNFTDANIGDINGMGGYDTIVTGYDADVTAGNISNVGQIVVGSGVSSDDKAKFTATSISGTEYNDAIVFGNFVEAYIGEANVVGDIDLGAGYNQIVTGYANDVTAGNITGVGALVVNSGVSSDDKAEFTATSISGTEYNDTVVFGNFVEANVGDIDLGAGYNAISTGYDADVTTGDITGVGQLVVGNGVSSENESEFDAGNITGTQYNDVFSFGHYTDVEFDSLTLGEGNDYLANGSYSEIETAGTIDFGAGYDNMVVGNYSRAEAGSLDFGADYDTLTLGYKSELTIGENVKNVEAIYAGADSKIIVTDLNEDVNLDKVAGTWQNATIYDIEGVLADGENALDGSVYSNEWDVYTFNVTGDSNNDLSIIGADNTIQVDLYQMVDGEWTSLGTVHPFYDIETGKSSLENGQYAIAVKVDGADFNKENDDNNKYSFTAKLA